MKRSDYLKPILLLAFFVVALTACRKEDWWDYGGKPGHGSHPDSENAMVLFWNERLETVLSTPMRPPDRGRVFAMVEIAVHDALNNIKPRYKRFALNAQNGSASKDAAVASAAYHAIIGLDLTRGFPVQDWYDSVMALIPEGAAKQKGIALGQKAAEAIIANRANDGYTEVISSSPNPPDGTEPGEYRQTNAVPFRMIPNWGTVLRPWVLQSNYQFRPAGPYAVTSREYAIDFNEVKKKGARVGSNRTPHEEKLAQFWADNRISVLWNQFARKAIANRKMDAWETARYFAVLHTALADGFNTALESKYHFYYWRPETAIKEAANDGNPKTEPDPNWVPFVIETVQPTPPGNWVSPPIPEYPSSYAMAGGVATEVIKQLLGTDRITIDMTSDLLPGVTIRYNSLSQAARDNSLAKIYAGWYFRKAVLDGEDMGRKIASYVVKNGFK